MYPIIFPVQTATSILVLDIEPAFADQHQQDGGSLQLADELSGEIIPCLDSSHIEEDPL